MRLTLAQKSVEVGKWTALITLTFLTLYPFLFMLMSSVKSNAQIYTTFWGLASPVHWDNYAVAWRMISPFVFNSVYITAVSVITSVFFASLTAYVIARFEFPGREFFYYAIIAIVMIPGILTLIPQYILIKNMGMRDTRWALFFPYISYGQVFAVFILRTFFAGISDELIDAARIDGSGHLRIYFTIILPLSKPIIGTVALMRVITIWNDFIWPLVVMSQKKMFTITVGLAYLTSEYKVEYGQAFAGYVIASLPLLVLFLFTMKTFVRGITSGALKA